MSEVMNSHIRHLQERLAAKEAECTLLAAHNRKLEEALRPFVKAYRADTPHIMSMLVKEHFARAAELVPAEPTASSLSAAPSPP